MLVILSVLLLLTLSLPIYNAIFLLVFYPLRSVNRQSIRLSWISFIMLFCMGFYYAYGFRDYITLPSHELEITYKQYTSGLVYGIDDSFIPILLGIGIVFSIIMHYSQRDSRRSEIVYDILYLTFLGVAISASAHILGINAFALKTLWVGVGAIILTIRWIPIGSMIATAITEIAIGLWRVVEAFGIMLINLAKTVVAILITLFRLLEAAIRAAFDWLIANPFELLRKLLYSLVFWITLVADRFDTFASGLLDIAYASSDPSKDRVRRHIDGQSTHKTADKPQSTGLWNEIKEIKACNFRTRKHDWRVPSDTLRVCFHCGQVICRIHFRMVAIPTADLSKCRLDSVATWYDDYLHADNLFLVERFGRAVGKAGSSIDTEIDVYICKDHPQKQLEYLSVDLPSSGREDLHRMWEKLREYWTNLSRDLKSFGRAIVSLFHSALMLIRKVGKR